MAGDMKRTSGLTQLLDWAAAKNVKTAVVTNAPRANAEMMLAALRLETRFPVVVIGDELARGKPDPLPYTTALQRLDAHADRSLAFEDSRSGIAAASAAGIFTFGMTTGLDEATLQAAGAHAAIRDFADPLLLRTLTARFGSAPG